MFGLPLQKQFIQNEEWDLLLILDACRYDYFNELNVIPGKLYAVDSANHYTPSWIATTFPYIYDYVYCSGNPLIGNYDLGPWGFPGYKADDHFFKVDPVWDWGWNKKLRTVEPYMMIQSIFSNLPEQKRLIAHFLQPHGPYIGYTRLHVSTLQKTVNEAKGLADPEVADNPLFSHPLLEQAYKHNLEHVLYFIGGVCERYAEEYKIVISSDHGELLGLKYPGKVGHSADDKEYVELRKVPWLEVDRDAKIKIRLKDLGY